LLILPLLAEGATIDQWRSRSVYQVLTDRFAPSYFSAFKCQTLKNYCGGTWKGLEKNLGYIEKLGFDAIWISPVVSNFPGGYHGYWTKDFEGLNSNFGTEQDLISLIRAAHKRDIYVMVDVVANHVGYVPKVNIHEDFRGVYPFDQASHYHEHCEIEDWNDPL